MKPYLLLILSALILSFAQCKEEDDDSNDDLTVNVVGHYTNTADDADITVNKINNTTVSITIDSDYWDFAFTEATMTSATAFTLTSYSRTDDGCEGTETISGTGTASNNNISFFINIDASNVGVVYPCSDTDVNISATKQ